MYSSWIAKTSQETRTPTSTETPREAGGGFSISMTQKPKEDTACPQRRLGTIHQQLQRGDEAWTWYCPLR